MEFKIFAILCLAITFTISEATQDEGIGEGEVVNNFEFDRGVSFLAVRGGKMISELSKVLWSIFEILWPLRLTLVYFIKWKTNISICP